MGWESIESAPKDGRILRVRRLQDGNPPYEGPAAWRTVSFPAMVNEVMNDPILDIPGWVAVDTDLLMSKPTHWWNDASE